MNTTGAPAHTTVEYLLGLGDDALVAAQRLGEWVTAAPELEEDVALANIALDQLGAARLLLSYAGELEGLAGTRTRWRTCAPTGSTATACWSSCPTATSRRRWRSCSSWRRTSSRSTPR
ncbi:hypothetical protein GCM10027615_09170 [Plantactinospora veratri]